MSLGTDFTMLNLKGTATVTLKESVSEMEAALIKPCNLLQTQSKLVPGRVAQSVRCPAADTCLTADPGVESLLILARSYTFVEIDHGKISMVTLLPSADSRRVVSYKRKYVHEVLVLNCLVKLAKEKVWLGG